MWPVLIPEEDSRTSDAIALRSEHPAYYRVLLKEDVVFIDNGANLERITCPCCGADVDLDWWSDAMDRAHSNRFRDLDVETPCCHRETELSALKYDWPVGFARFCIDIRSPGHDIDPAHTQRVGQALGCGVHRIWQHL